MFSTYQKLTILVAFLVLPAMLVAQKYSGFIYPDTLPEVYHKDYRQLYQFLQDEVPKDLGEKYPRLKLQYAQTNAYYISQVVSNGYTYPGWEEMEGYVNEVMQSILPEDLKGKSNIHAYIVRDASLNAFMTASGDFFIHIGLLARLEDEAALAAVVAHEVAHYYQKHLFMDYVAQKENFYSRPMGLFGNPYKYASLFSIHQELESDSFSMAWMANAGYSIEGSVNVFRLFQRERDRLKRVYRGKYGDSRRSRRNGYQSHPLIKDRLVAVSRFIETHPDLAGKKFVLSEDRFLKLQRQARMANLDALMSDLSFRECSEAAFRFHLFDPDNEAYVYYILESIRRMAYFEPKLWASNFIASRYKTKASNKPHTDPVQSTEHLFASFDTEIMALSPAEMRSIQTRFYWQGEPLFRSYEEAFVFFFRVAEKMECNECLLSNALSIDKGAKERKVMLKRYLAADNIAHRHYAETLLANNIYDALPEKKLMLFNHFNVVINQGQEKVYLSMQNSSENKTLDSLFTNIETRYPGRTSLFLPTAKDTLLRDFLLFQELYSISDANMILLGKRIQLHEIDPRYWELLERYGINEIEFLNCTYAEYRKKETTAEALDQVQQLDYATIFDVSGGTRMLETYITAFKECEKGRTVAIYYAREQKMKAKQTGFVSIEAFLRQAIVEKEALMDKPLQQLDRQVRVRRY